MTIDITARALAIQAGRQQPTRYTGQAATRCVTNNFNNTNYQAANGNSLHIAREAMATMPQIAFANWFVSTSTFAETGSGGTARFWTKIQYPIGSAWQTVLWNGADGSPVVADGDTSPLSDSGVALATPIPDGAAFLIHVHTEAQAAVVFSYSSAIDRRTGYDRVQLAATLSDSTTISSPTNLAFITPAAIVYPTRKPSVAMFGDSRGFGFGDSMDGTGDLGEMARSIGPRFGYVNACLYSDRLDHFMAGHVRRVALAAHCSHVLCNYGINDLQSLPQRTADEVEADIQAFSALFPDKPVFWNTISPSSDSNDQFTTISGQTPNNASQANRIAMNDHLRRNIRGSDGSPLGLAGMFDTAAVTESSLNSGRFAIGNGGQAITGDGLHPNYIGYAMIRQVIAANASLITR
ncbi:SGNH/GDSL hydrolase family protein [Stakelama sp. CBK3Z-3]|uniref:SGNH/GDSL hydrolase family protein n=1 Tax=Stakelama flava TaxID=2860338 RepID=A0ABS6XI73_9SPHN|nr:SGNH/GDSL hydrolase family protein [Stakelama flava]MBW4329903.1 SGNH/GDSL hydrolase family protein [Stakelama flava]